MTMVTAALFILALAAVTVSQLVPPTQLDHRVLLYNAERRLLAPEDDVQSDISPPNLPLEPLTSEEVTVNALLSKLKTEFITSGAIAGEGLFTNASTRSLFEGTKLYGFIKSMPKGGDLHVHDDSMVDNQWFCDVGLKLEGARVDWSGNCSLTFNASLGPQYELVKDVVAKVGATAFCDRLKSELSIAACPPDGPALSPAGQRHVWTSFQNVFGKVAGFMQNRAARVMYLTAAFEQLATDNVFYVEIRDGSPMDNTTFSIYDEALAAIRKTYPEFNAKIIHSVLRSLPQDTMFETVVSTAKAMMHRPDWVVGYDMDGEECVGCIPNEQTTLFYIREYLQLPEIQDKYSSGQPLPLILHDGESSNLTDTNVLDAVLLKAHRIGHGFNSFRFPAAINLARRQNTSIEVCPMSNQALRLCPGNLTQHPGRLYLLENGLDVTIANDDPSIFGYSGLTYDYTSVAVAWDLNLQWLKRLAFNGVRLASPRVTGQERETIINTWQQKWQAWIHSQAQQL